MDRYDVAVLGAGPAGVMAALEATRRGRRTVLVEANDHVGGMAASPEIAGVRVDLGSHRLHPVVPPSVEEVLFPLLGDDLQARVRRGRIHMQGQWLKFPLEIGDLVRNLPRSFAVKAGWETLTSPFRRAREDTAYDVISARLGPTVAAQFYLPYLTKLWDTPPTELSAELADRRVSARGPGDILKKMLSRNERDFDFWYPRRGFGQISEVLAQAAVDEGADLRLSTPVEALDARRRRHHDHGPATTRSPPPPWSARCPPRCWPAWPAPPRTCWRRRGACATAPWCWSSSCSTPRS